MPSAPRFADARLVEFVGEAVSAFRGWLREPDQFDWLTALLKQRGLLRTARTLMALVSASAAMAPISALFTSREVSTTSIAVGASGAALAAIMTWYWLTRWPTRRQSLYSVLIGAGCAAGWSLNQSVPTIAALACMVFAITGGYAAFFHSARALLVNTLIAIPTALVVTVRLAEAIDVSTAVSALWLMTLLNIAIPLGFRAAIKAMRQFAIRSDEDPLTGLLNRRGFSDVVSHQLIPQVRNDLTGNLVVLMIDLDDFKRVNDTQGHAAGDRILLGMAALLRDRMPGDAAICRAGGEEFLVAVSTPAHVVPTIALSLCDAIRTHCYDVTASVGMACADGRALKWTNSDALVASLIEAADAAMYEAKRSGGNRVHMADASA